MRTPRLLRDTLALRLALTTLATILVIVLIGTAFTLLNSNLARPPLEHTGLLNEVSVGLRMLDAAPPERRPELADAAGNGDPAGRRAVDRRVAQHGGRSETRRPGLPHARAVAELAAAVPRRSPPAGPAHCCHSAARRQLGRVHRRRTELGPDAARAARHLHCHRHSVDHPGVVRLDPPARPPDRAFYRCRRTVRARSQGGADRRDRAGRAAPRRPRLQRHAGERAALYRGSHPDGRRDLP